jgi:HEAT repeat protein
LNQLEQLLKDLRHNEKCVDAAHKLAIIGNASALNGLIEALEDTNPRVRNFATLALADMANPKATESLIYLLQDLDISVRASAAFALGKIGEPSSLPVLTKALKESIDVDAHLCRQLIVAVADISGSEATDTILYALQSRIPKVRATAVEFLAYTGNEHIRSSLIELLEYETDEDVRNTIKNALKMTSS